jgi:two-component system, chemotaxis family, response regulator Rcp1
MAKLIEILLVDDNPADVELTMEALNRTKLANNIVVVGDGVECMQYLRCEGSYTDCTRPNLILLDLNMPRKDGREVLEELKADPNLKTIPVVVLTTSQAEEDILKSYQLHANCYVKKPVSINQLAEIVQTIENFWFGVVELPPRP